MADTRIPTNCCALSLPHGHTGISSHVEDKSCLGYVAAIFYAYIARPVVLHCRNMPSAIKRT